MRKLIGIILVGIVISTLLLFFGFVWTAFILMFLLVLSSAIIFNVVFVTLLGCFEVMGIQMNKANFRSMFYEGRAAIEEFNESYKNGSY